MSMLGESRPRRHRITVDEYHRMAEVGLLDAEARVELIDGEIIDMPPIGVGHASVVDQLNRRLISAVDDTAIVRVQGPIRLSRMSEPEPDLSVLEPRPDYYSTRPPTASETLLVVEVSDTTLHFDREIKVPLYARHGVPEIWLVDVPDGRVYFYRSPEHGEYTSCASSDAPGPVELAALPKISIDLSDLVLS